MSLFLQLDFAYNFNIISFDNYDNYFVMTFRILFFSYHLNVLQKQVNKDLLYLVFLILLS